MYPSDGDRVNSKFEAHCSAPGQGRIGSQSRRARWVHQSCGLVARGLDARRGSEICEGAEALGFAARGPNGPRPRPAWAFFGFRHHTPILAFVRPGARRPLAPGLD